MSIEVFNRYEYKYKISKFQYNMLITYLHKNMNLDEYCKKHGYYNIINYYVDTKDFNLIRTSLTKPLYKQKLRIRTYQEITNDDDFVFLEIKKKYKGIVNKRRTKLKYKDALALVEQKQMPKYEKYMNSQILNEIHYIISRHNYELKSKIMYRRIAYFSDDRKLRVSFDFNIHSQVNNILDDNLILLEIKTPEAIPLWLVRALDEIEIRSTSFSKYGIDYLTNIKELNYEYITN